MSKKAKKYYVVWSWRKTWIFDTWEACKQQVDWQKQAIYKSFSTKDEATKAFSQSYELYIWKEVKQELTPSELKKYWKPIPLSISVDAAWNTATGMVEYQWVETSTLKKLFHVWPLEDGTNNIVEFLAIVHALSYCQKKWITLPIYSDSRNAIKWVREKKINTTLEKTERNKPLFDLVIRAIVWLETNTYPNKILKWETKAWGENPADFGRK
jgi:ribonuclease HI